MAKMVKEINMNRIKAWLVAFVSFLFLVCWAAYAGAEQAKAAAPCADKEKAAAPDVPRDNPADVKLLKSCLPGRVLETGEEGKTLGKGVVATLSLDADKLVGNVELQRAIARLRHVQCLFSGGKTGDDLLLAATAAWPAENLRHVSLPADVGDDALGRLERFRNLRSLDISSDRITDGAFRHLGKLTNLNRITIDSPRPLTLDGRLKINGSGLKDLAGLKKLKSLGILDCPIDDAGMRNLKGLSLEELDLRHAVITDRGIEAISDMTTLERLAFADTAITDKAFIDLAKLQNLRVLSVAGAPGIQGTRLKEISGLKNLEFLYLLDCPIDDAAIKSLKGMKLKVLGLCLTQITDRALDDIKDMTTLKQLYVGSTKVTKAAIAKLRGIRALEINDAPVDRKEFGLQGDKK